MLTMLVTLVKSTANVQVYSVPVNSIPREILILIVPNISDVIFPFHVLQMKSW